MFQIKIFVDGSVMEIPSTGIAKSTLELYKNCVKLDPSLEVIILHKDDLKCDLPSGIQSVQLGSYMPRILWRKIILPLYIYIKKPDFVHFPWNGKVPGLIKNTKIITTINDLKPLEVPDFFKNIEDKKKYRDDTQKSIVRSDLIITISQFSKKDIIKNFNPEQDIFVLYLGPTINCEPSHKTRVDTNEQGNRSTDSYFIYVGGYAKPKGIEELIETFMKLYDEEKVKSKLVLTGDKLYYSSYFEGLIKQGKEKGFLEEMGYVTESELCELYSNALALVYPSTFEGFGLPPLEAMTLGCPVITTRNTSIPEVCGNAAYYIDLTDVEGFGQSFIDLENDPELRLKLVSDGKRQASKFSWKSISQSFLDRLSDLINSQN